MSPNLAINLLVRLSLSQSVSQHVGQSVSSVCQREVWRQKSVKVRKSHEHVYVKSWRHIYKWERHVRAAVCVSVRGAAWGSGSCVGGRGEARLVSMAVLQ